VACDTAWEPHYPECEGAPVCTASADALAVAQTLLDAATGRQFGVCEYEYTIPHTSAGCCAASGAAWYAPGNCGCQPLDPAQLPLPETPVQTVSGIALPDAPAPAVVGSAIVGVSRVGDAGGFSAWYQLGDSVVRTDGEPWQPGTVVSYSAGVPLPLAGQIALALLACQLDAAWCGGDCQLPSNVSSITRENVSITYDIAAGGFNIPAVDLWVNAVKPSGTGGGFFSLRGCN